MSKGVELHQEESLGETMVREAKEDLHLPENVMRSLVGLVADIPMAQGSAGSAHPRESYIVFTCGCSMWMSRMWNR